MRKVQAESGDAQAERIASESLSFLMFIVGGVCIVMQIAMPWIMHVLLSAYVQRPEIFTLAIFVTQITMPYLFCMTMASLLSGVLNTRGKFALSAAVLTLFNLCTLAPLVLMPPGRINARLCRRRGGDGFRRPAGGLFMVGRAPRRHSAGAALARG